jgi:hypothetical protein
MGHSPFLMAVYTVPFIVPLANRFRASRLALSRQLLASSSATEEQGGTYDVRSENCLSLALPTLWRIDDRHSEIYC